MHNKEKSNTHIEGLDGLRGIAVIGVVLYHSYPSTVKGGFLGVCIFFALSGYLIAITSENSWRKKDFNLLTFYKKRIKRIYPPLIIMVLATTGFLILSKSDAIRGICKELFSVFLGYNNWWQITQNASYFAKINNATPFTHLWSLSIELQYYLIWPLLFALYKLIKNRLSKKNPSYIFIIPAIISFLLMMFIYKAGEDPSRVYYGTDTRLFSLLLGAVLGLSFSNRKVRPLKSRETKKCIGLFSICIISVIFLYIFMDGKSSFTYKGGMFIANLIFMEIIVLASNPYLPVGRWLDIKPLSFIGKMSYEIYLWQYAVIYFFNYANLGNTFLQRTVEILVILVLSFWLHTLLNKNKDKNKKKNKNSNTLHTNKVYKNKLKYERC